MNIGHRSTPNYRKAWGKKSAGEYQRTFFKFQRCRGYLVVCGGQPGVYLCRLNSGSSCLKKGHAAWTSIHTRLERALNQSGAKTQLATTYHTLVENPDRKHVLNNVLWQTALADRPTALHPALKGTPSCRRFWWLVLANAPTEDFLHECHCDLTDGVLAHDQELVSVAHVQPCAQNTSSFSAAQVNRGGLPGPSNHATLPFAGEHPNQVESTILPAALYDASS